MPSMPRAFFDIDTQFDFMNPAGKLYVPGAESIIPALRQLFEKAAADRIPVISSTDDHPVDDPEFARFPPHCVRGTPGQRKLAETLLPGSITLAADAATADLEHVFDRTPQVIIPKVTFDVFDNPVTARLTRAMGPTEFIVFGVATDYCVAAAAVSLAMLGARVGVVEDAVRGISDDTTAAAWERMQHAGARRVKLKDVL